MSDHHGAETPKHSELLNVSNGWSRDMGCGSSKVAGEDPTEPGAGSAGLGKPAALRKAAPSTRRARSRVHQNRTTSSRPSSGSGASRSTRPTCEASALMM